MDVGVDARLGRRRRPSVSRGMDIALSYATAENGFCHLVAGAGVRVHFLSRR